MATDIAIAGGGIAGLTLAILLAQQGKRVALAEPHPPAPLADTCPTGRSLALMTRSVDVLIRTGAWGAMNGHAQEIAGFCLIDDSGGAQVRADFAAPTMGFARFGYNVPNTILRAALWEAAARTPGIALHDQAFEGYTLDDTHVRVMLRGGGEVAARLLVGADGRDSPVRTAAGLRAYRRAVGQSAFTARVAHTLSHNGTASEFHRPGGLLALVPLPGQTSAVVWMDAPGALPAPDDPDAGVMLRAASHGVLGDITLEGPGEIWPLERVYVPRVTAPRVALVAEAAHGFPPTGAQGLNLSLRDVAVLADRAGHADDPGGALGAYARARALDTATTLAGVMGMNAAIAARAKPVRAARRALLRAASALPPLQRVVVRGGLAWQAASGGL